MINEEYLDVIKWSLYDTLSIESGTSFRRTDSIELFSMPQGSEKNWIETNLQIARQLPAPCHFNIESMRPSYAETNSNDANIQFRENIGFNLWIGCKIYSMGPMAMFHDWTSTNDLARLLRLIKAAKQLGFKVTNNLDFRIGDNPIGHHILQGQQFYLKLVFNRDITFFQDFKLYWFLDGVIARGIA